MSVPPSSWLCFYKHKHLFLVHAPFMCSYQTAIAGFFFFALFVSAAWGVLVVHFLVFKDQFPDLQHTAGTGTLSSERAGMSKIERAGNKTNDNIPFHCPSQLLNARNLFRSTNFTQRGDSIC